jgi:hypothetical protein
MKLDRTISAALATALVSLACLVGGCSSAPASVKSASSPADLATIPNTVGTTNLMSAELQGPAPKVGKAHLAVDDESFEPTSSDEPKEARRSDGSHRRGGFGTSK